MDHPVHVGAHHVFARGRSSCWNASVYNWYIKLAIVALDPVSNCHRSTAGDTKRDETRREDSSRPTAAGTERKRVHVESVRCVRENARDATRWCDSSSCLAGTRCMFAARLHRYYGHCSELITRLPCAFPHLQWVTKVSARSQLKLCLAVRRCFIFPGARSHSGRNAGCCSLVLLIFSLLFSFFFLSFFQLHVVFSFIDLLTEESLLVHSFGNYEALGLFQKR